MKNKGFTLTELLICIAVAGIAAAIALHLWSSQIPIETKSCKPKLSAEDYYKPREVCIRGYVFIQIANPGNNAFQLMQLVDHNGSGIPCPVE